MSRYVFGTAVGVTGAAGVDVGGDPYWYPGGGGPVSG